MIFAQANSDDAWTCAVIAVVLGVLGISVAWKMMRADARRVRQWQINRDARDTRRRGFAPILKQDNKPGKREG